MSPQDEFTVVAPLRQRVKELEEQLREMELENIALRLERLQLINRPLTE